VKKRDIWHLISELPPPGHIVFNAWLYVPDSIPHGCVIPVRYEDDGKFHFYPKDRIFRLKDKNSKPYKIIQFISGEFIVTGTHWKLRGKNACGSPNAPHNQARSDLEREYIDQEVIK
jgi:hypothetical protein